MNDQEKKLGRPFSIAPRRTIDIKTVDPVTYRMIESLASYGRFGTTNPEVALFIIRNWLMEHEEYLKNAIASRENPLGHIQRESD
jgi:hypothetical protein